MRFSSLLACQLNATADHGRFTPQALLCHDEAVERHFPISVGKADGDFSRDAGEVLRADRIISLGCKDIEGQSDSRRWKREGLSVWVTDCFYRESNVNVRTA